MRLVAVLLAVTSLATAETPPGGEATPEHKKATELVRQLGSGRFATREEAGKQLLEMGAPAMPALANGSKSADEEVRNRATVLLKQVRARRADAYAADKDGMQKHDLPLLTEWEKATGKPDAESRRLFAAMLQAEGELLEQVAAEPKRAGDLVQLRFRALVGMIKVGVNQPKLDAGQLAAIFFAHLQSPDASAAPDQVQPYHLLINPGIREAMTLKEVGSAFRRLVVAWGLVKTSNDAVRDPFLASLLLLQPSFEAVPVLARIAKDDKADARSSRGIAIEALGKISNTEAKQVLAGLIEDKTELFRAGKIDCRVGDHALASLLIASSKKPEDYGLATGVSIVVQLGATGPVRVVTFRSFPDEAARKKGIQKWKDESAKK